MLGFVAMTVLFPARAQAQEPAPRLLQVPGEIGPAVRRCWRVPPGLRGFERLEATVRFSLRVDGSLIGTERISYLPFPGDERARELLAQSVRDAVEACAPLPLGAGLGAAIAGRVFSVRFIYQGPRGRGA